MFGYKYVSNKQAAASAENAEQSRREHEAAVNAYAEANPDVDERYITAMREKKVMLGMTAEQVRLSWGEPTKINRSVNIGGTREQWVYRKTGLKTAYVYIENGLVTSIQN